MKWLRIIVRGQFVYVPMPAELMAFFKQQFVREYPTPEQRKKYKTIMNLLAITYLCGLERGGEIQMP